MLTFPLPYSFRDGLEQTTTYATTTVSFASGKKQVQRNAKQPIIKYKIKCAGNETQGQTLETFFDNVGGNTSVFLFPLPDGTTINARFSDQSLAIKYIPEYAPDNPPTYSRIVGFTADITVETVL